MRLEQISAAAHPAGNRIDLSWAFPAGATPCAVCVVRRADRYPEGPEDGKIVTIGWLPYAYDEGLASERTYYYTFFPIEDGFPQNFDPESVPYNRAAALATGRYDMAGRLYELLPALYRRYDGADGYGLPLRRFLNLPGGQLDQLYSRARALLNLYDIDRGDGRLLGLLADWIGWRIDFRNNIQTQRNELQSAPYIQDITGTIPMIEATVKRVFGWECRAKEFAGNVFRSNQPERLNLWGMERAHADVWDAPALLSLDFAYEGRPAVTSHSTPDGATRHWLFYHTPLTTSAQTGAGSIPPMNGWRICCKTALSFHLSSKDYKHHFTQGTVSPALLAEFARHGLALSLNLNIAEQGAAAGQPHSWLLSDRSSGARYRVRESGVDHLLVQSDWSPSQPISEPPPGHMDRHPSAAWLGDVLWLFWDVYNEQTKTWQIMYRTCRDGDWQEPNSLPWTGQSRAPCAVIHADKLRLFWLQRDGEGWRLLYSTLAGGIWSAPTSFPPFSIRRAEGVQMIDPHVEDDVFALSVSDQKLWLFWALRVPVQRSPGQTCWRVAYRVAQSADLTNWGKIVTLPSSLDVEEREPAAGVGPQGIVELFWSSTRDGSWSIWHGELVESEGLQNVSPLSTGPYSQRTPVPLSYGDHTLLVYRSSESLIYASAEYSATRTLDTRYAGSTSVEPRNAARRALRCQFADFECYSYAVGPREGPDNRTWYRRDTVGLYLRPGNEDGKDITRYQRQIEYLLRQFLPIQVRVVFIIEPWPVAEQVYDYHTQKGRRIGEEQKLRLTAVIAELYQGVADTRRKDSIRGWEWVEAWRPAKPPEVAKPTDITNNIRYRTWHQDVDLEE